MSNMNPAQDKQIAITVLLGGIFGMMVAMGIGRFAYTPILPLMQRDLGINNSVAGSLAALNYTGYLMGALLCMLSPTVLRQRAFPATALVLSIATTLGMGLTTSTLLWSAMRFTGGVASAVLFIIITAEVAETLIRHHHGHWLGTLYSGIGLGIAASGALVPWLSHLGGWSGAWLGMAALSVVMSAIGLILGRRHIDVHPTTRNLSSCPSQPRHPLWPLAIAYFLEGLGYIVSATFLVAMIAATPGLEDFAPYSWTIVGLAAIPSTLIWPFVAQRIGQQKALIAAFSIQAAGTLVSMYADSVAEVVFCATSFGATFLGIVALTLSEGNRRWPAETHHAAAILTTAFSLGQMFGPAIAGVLADHESGFALPLGLAGSCVICGGIILFFDHFPPR